MTTWKPKNTPFPKKPPSQPLQSKIVQQAFQRVIRQLKKTT